jgi:hypothetical protein
MFVLDGASRPRSPSACAAVWLYLLFGMLIADPV